MNLNKYIIKVKDFPTKGVIFSDISKLIESGEAFRFVVDKLTQFAKKVKPTKIIGIEARGFIFGTPIAYNLGIGFALVRKPNKLPRDYVIASTLIEYGERQLTIHRDSLEPGERVLIVDDILATGGSVAATISLISQLKANVVGICFLGRIKKFNGERVIKDYKSKWLLEL